MRVSSIVPLVGGRFVFKVTYRMLSEQNAEEESHQSSPFLKISNKTVERANTSLLKSFGDGSLNFL